MIIVFIVDDILLAPARALFFIFQEIHKRVEEELYDEERIINQLRSLQTSLELGDITEEEYDRVEEKLMERLETARERNKVLSGEE